MKREESMDGYWEPGGDTFTFEDTTHACREISQGFARTESQNVNINFQDMQIFHGGFILLEILVTRTLFQFHGGLGNFHSQVKSLQ